ncbi:MAG TPA: class I SAM-dependent methyltransferase [Nitrososphaera sp.]|nr:class I SAM-dependent methyltransferase [Nitrososphaera sp.]
MGKNDITDKEIASIGPVLQRLVWSESLTREKIQEYGVNVIPSDFYSNTPSIEEIKNSYEYKEKAPYLNEDLFNDEFLTEVLRDLSEYSSEFNPDTDGDENDCRQFFWRNSQFSYSDAMSYYCFLRKYKPARVVEIGSGFSTLIAMEATQRNGFGEITCIEPFPRPFLERNARVKLLRMKAQELPLEFLNESLEGGDFLFIDSTHTVKTGSDCLHIYLRLLPRIKRKIYVHVHDISLPFGMPVEWLLERQIFWTEQYLLLAFLIDNPKIKVLYASAYHHASNREALDTFMNNKWASGGGSFWFQYDGGKETR